MKKQELNKMMESLERDRKANQKMSRFFQNSLNQTMQFSLADFQNRYSRGQYKNK